MKKYDTEHSRILRSLSRFNLTALAKASGWLAREGGKLSPLDFCAAMIEASSISAASLRIVAFLSGAFSSDGVSKQALHKRINARACKLFESLLGEVISSKTGTSAPKIKLGFSRIIVQDSTSIALPQHLLEVFKGAKNASGERSGMKIHASFDLLAKRFTDFEIREQRSSDQGFALEGIEGLGEGDLLLRDLGYFSIGSFRQLKRNKADVLTRWQPKVCLLDHGNLDTIDLLGLLRSSARIDRDVLVGKNERFRMRLIAFRVPQRIGEKRRRKLKETAKRKGRTPSRELLELQDWQIYLTTCDRERLSFEDAYDLYCQRWTIEVLFKGFKSHMHIDQIPPYVSEMMVRCLVFCTLIRIAQTSVVTLSILEKTLKEPSVSALKLFSLVEALGFEPDFSYFCDRANLDNFLKHCRYEKRKRKPLPQILDSLG